jgi:hypothetical protein
MASEAHGHASSGKEFAEINMPEEGELHQDVEVGPEMVNVDRIERVYA